MQVIELGSLAAVKEHGNLWHTFAAYVQRTFGNHTEEVFKRINRAYNRVEGTIIAKDGTPYDIVWNGQEYTHIDARGPQ